MKHGALDIGIAIAVPVILAILFAHETGTRRAAAVKTEPPAPPVFDQNTYDPALPPGNTIDLSGWDPSFPINVTGPVYPTVPIMTPANVSTGNAACGCNSAVVDTLAAQQSAADAAYNALARALAGLGESQLPGANLYVINRQPAPAPWRLPPPTVSAPFSPGQIPWQTLTTGGYSSPTGLASLR